MINRKRMELVFYIYVVALVILNFIRIFDNSFWGDECYSLKIVNLPLFEMLHETANDVHPPLYYMLLMLLIRIFGEYPWVYHLSSFIPYCGIMALIVFNIKNKWGLMSAALLSSFVSLLQNSMEYSIEVRMYELAAFGLFLACLSFYDLLQKESVSSYCMFCIGSLVAVYSQYITVLTAAPMYVALLVFTLKMKRKIANVMSVYIITVVGYLPWLANSFRFVNDVNSNGFWLSSNPDLKWILLYYFNTNKYYAAFMLLVTFAVLAISIWNWKNKDQSELFWVLACVFASFFPVLGLEAISQVTGPCIIMRYFYPASIVLMTVLAFLMRGLKGQYLSICVLFITVIVGAINYVHVFSRERDEDAAGAVAQQTMLKEISKSDIILTNFSHYSWTIMDYYMPGYNCITVSSSDTMPYSIDYKLDDENHYWALWKSEFSDYDKKWLIQNNYDWNPIIEKGKLGGGKSIPL